LVFFVLACLCMCTLSVVALWAGSCNWAAFHYAYIRTLAYVVTITFPLGGRALGFGG
jgi:ferrous iron transport protein B